MQTKEKMVIITIIIRNKNQMITITITIIIGKQSVKYFNPFQSIYFKIF